MSIEEITTLAEKANEVNENNNSDTRYWIENMDGEDRFFICYNILEMDDIEEVCEDHFIARAQRTIAAN